MKTNNTDNLNLPSSWVGGATPTAIDTAVWNNTVTGANTTLLGVNTNWAGIQVKNPGGLVTISAGNTLTLGAAATNIDLSAATQDLTLNCGLALGAASVWDVAAGRTLTVGGAVSGTNSVTMQNAGTNILSSSANSYSGATIVSAGSTLKLGAANVIPDGAGKSNVAVDGLLDLNAFSESINSLSGAGTVDTVAGGTPTLTIGANSAYTNNPFNGALQNTAGTLALTKTGTNLIILAGGSTLSGAVKVNEGYLAVGSVSVTTDVLPNVSGITISNGATLAAWSATTLAAPITVASGGTAAIAAPINPLSGSGTTAKILSLQGGISGNGNVIFKGVNQGNSYGHILVANCTYTGSTLITCSEDLVGQLGYAAIVTNNNEIIVRLGGDNALPPATVLTMDGNVGVGSGRYCDLNLNGHNQTLAGLTNVARTLRFQRVINPGASAAVLTINNNADYEFSGQLGGSGGSLGTGGVGNNFGLVKSGSGTFTLSRAAGNTYTGDTTVSNGTLVIKVATIATNSTVTVASGAVLKLDFAGTNQVAGFVTNGVALPGGVYSAANVAPFINGTGSLVVPSAGPSGPGVLTNSYSGGTLNLSWPAGEGWRLQAQTNALNVGLSPTWVYLTDGSASSTNITVNPVDPTVFYRLTYP